MCPVRVAPLENGRVLNSTKLRINPASVFPTPPSGHAVCPSLAPWWLPPLTSYAQFYGGRAEAVSQPSWLQEVRGDSAFLVFSKVYHAIS